jgi:hypothetical protein
MPRATLAALLFVALAITPAYAGGHKAAPKPKPSPPKTVVTNVSANAVTINEGLGGKTLNVTPFTEIIVNGQKAGLADVKKGMIVDVVLRDPTTASRITAVASK